MIILIHGKVVTGMLLVIGHKFLHSDNGVQLLLVYGHPELFHGASTDRNCIHSLFFSI